jgi:hypothetical protein
MSKSVQCDYLCYSKSVFTANEYHSYEVHKIAEKRFGNYVYFIEYHSTLDVYTECPSGKSVFHINVGTVMNKTKIYSTYKVCFLQ